MCVYLSWKKLCTLTVYPFCGCCQFHVHRLTHWGRATHICVGKLTIIGSDNGLSPGRRQSIIWTSAGILLLGPLGTYFSEFFIGIQTFSFKKIHLKMSSGKRRPFCLGLNVIMGYQVITDMTLNQVHKKGLSHLDMSFISLCYDVTSRWLK